MCCKFYIIHNLSKKDKGVRTYAQQAVKRFRDVCLTDHLSMEVVGFVLTLSIVVDQLKFSMPSDIYWLMVLLELSINHDASCLMMIIVYLFIYLLLCALWYKCVCSCSRGTSDGFNLLFSEYCCSACEWHALHVDGSKSRLFTPCFAFEWCMC